MAKIIVTGGSGFIGTNLVEALLADSNDIINIDIKDPQIEKHKSLYKKIDIRDSNELEKCFVDFEPEYIIHLAARCDLNGKTIDDYDTNIKGVENIIEAAKKCTSLKKILVTSSMLVCHPGYAPRGEEDYCATTIYGESKIITERITREGGISCDWAILRPTSIWGPWFGEPYKDFFEMIEKGRYIHIGGNKAEMTYGYVGNAVRQILAVLYADTRKGTKVFYLGDYIATPIEKWADEIAHEFNRKIITVPRWLINIGAKTGDLLKKIGIVFPLTTFRLNNMTMSNLIDLRETEKIIPQVPINRIDGVKETVIWIRREKK